MRHSPVPSGTGAKPRPALRVGFLLRKILDGFRAPWTCDHGPPSYHVTWPILEERVLSDTLAAGLAHAAVLSSQEGGPTRPGTTQLLRA